MGIRISCPNGHKLNVKDHLAGKRGICPTCRATFMIPAADAASASSASGAEPAIVGAAASHAGDLTAISGKSVVIPVVEPIVRAAPGTTPPTTAAPSVTKTTPASVQAPPPPSPAIAVQPHVGVSEAGASPSAQFIARRMRSRRNQTTLAIVLLLAVVMLAGVLIWVLSREHEAAGDTATARVSSATTIDGAFPAACNASSETTGALI